MHDPIIAIYENGVFRPLQSVSLSEQTIVSLSIVDQDDGSKSDADVLARQRQALNCMLEETASIPHEGLDDDFSNRDHDFALYGWKK